MDVLLSKGFRSRQVDPLKSTPAVPANVTRVDSPGGVCKFFATPFLGDFLHCFEKFPIFRFFVFCFLRNPG